MRLNEINKPNYYYVLNENVTNFYEQLYKNASAIKTMVEDDYENGVKVEKEINEFINKYGHCYLILRTLVSYDIKMSEQDSDRPSIIGVSKIVNANDTIEVCNELKRFYNDVINKDTSFAQMLKGTYNQFKNTMDRQLKTKDQRGYIGYPAIKDMLEILRSEVGTYILDFQNKHNSSREPQKELQSSSELSNTVKKEDFEITEGLKSKGYLKTIFESMNEAGYTQLTEANKKNDEEDEYFMIVDMKLYDNESSKKTPFRNFKNTLVAKAKDYDHARRILKSNANKSLKELNKYLKGRSKKEGRDMKVDFSRSDWEKYHTLHKGRENIKKKNIKGLTGTDFVSTGVMYLKGLDQNGNVSPNPECCPNKKAMIDSKASLTRYVNSQFNKNKS